MPINPNKKLSNGQIKGALCQCKSESYQKYKSAVHEQHFGYSHKEPKKKKPDIRKMFDMGGKKNRRK